MWQSWRLSQVDLDILIWSWGYHISWDDIEWNITGDVTRGTMEFPELCLRLVGVRFLNLSLKESLQVWQGSSPVQHHHWGRLCLFWELSELQQSPGPHLCWQGGDDWADDLGSQHHHRPCDRPVLQGCSQSNLLASPQVYYLNQMYFKAQEQVLSPKSKPKVHRERGLKVGFQLKSYSSWPYFHLPIPFLT